MNNYGEVDKTDRTELGKCIHLYDVTQGNKETQYNSFGHKIVFVKCKKNRQIIIKEEGSKEEDRQEEAEVKKIFC